MSIVIGILVGSGVFSLFAPAVGLILGLVISVPTFLVVVGICEELFK